MNTYYFVSDKIFNNKILCPRMIEHAPYKYHNNHSEENNPPHICVSKSIIGCLLATQDFLKEYKYIYLHTCHTDSAYQPTLMEVSDADITGEEWILEPVEMKIRTYYKLLINEINDNLIEYDYYDKVYNGHIKLYGFNFDKHYQSSV